MSKSEKTKAFIIEQIAPIFNKKGFVGTSLSDMTEATNLTKGSIYGNFAGKDEVALAAFDFNHRKIKSFLAQEIAKHSSAKEKLLVYGKVYGDYTHYPFPAGGCPVLNTAVESDDTHPELRKRVVVAIEEWKKKIEDIVRMGVQSKEFKEDVNPEQIALTLIALLEGGIMITKATNKASYRAAIAKAVESFIEQIS